MVLPGGGTLARGELWNRIEEKHKRGDALLAREFELAIPHELSPDQRRELIAAYAAELATTYGVAVDYNIHSPTHGAHKKEAPDHGSHDPRNFHCHMVLSACLVSSEGVCGKKCEALDPISCKRAGVKNPMEVQRERWQDLCNEALELAGHSARIDHRTLEAQGIDRAPGAHLGPAASAIAARGDHSTVVERIQAQHAEIELVAIDEIDQLVGLADIDSIEHDLDAARREYSGMLAVLDLPKCDEAIQRYSDYAVDVARWLGRSQPAAAIAAARAKIPEAQTAANTARRECERLTALVAGSNKAVVWLAKTDLKLDAAKETLKAARGRLGALQSTAEAPEREEMGRYQAHNAGLLATQQARQLALQAAIAARPAAPPEGAGEGQAGPEGVKDRAEVPKAPASASEAPEHHRPRYR